MEAIGTVSAITQLLGVAGKFFELYNKFRDAGLVHASNQAAIGRLSQTIDFAMGGLEYVGKELKDLKEEADKRRIEVPRWLKENSGDDAVPTSGSTRAAFCFGDWVAQSSSVLEEAHEALKQRPVKTNMQRWEFVFKGKKESSEKVKDKLRELQESFMVILLVIITGVPILRGRIEDDIKSKEGVPGVSKDTELTSNEGEAIPVNEPSEEVLERNKRYAEFVKNSESIMAFPQVNYTKENDHISSDPGTEPPSPSQDDYTSCSINDNNSFVECESIKGSGGKRVPRFRDRFLKISPNSGSKRHPEPYLINATQSIPRASTAQRSSIEGGEATVSPTNPDHNATYVEEKRPKYTEQQQLPQNNVDFLPTVERMIDRIIPLLTPQQPQLPIKAPKFSQASRLCTANYGYANSKWVPLFFQRSDNWIQLALLSKDQDRESVLVEPPIVEADEGSPLVSHLDRSDNILRLFYSRKDGPSSRVLHEKVLRFKLNMHSTWEEGSLHELNIQLSDDSDIILDYNMCTTEPLRVFIITPSFSLQVAQYNQGAWKVFTSMVLETTSIRILRVQLTGGFFLGVPQLTLLGYCNGCFAVYTWRPWEAKRFHLTQFKLRATRTYNGFSNMLRKLDCPCSIYTQEAKFYVDSQNYMSIATSLDGGIHSDNGEGKDPRERELCKLLHAEAYHIDYNSQSFIWLDAEGELRRIKRGHFDFFKEYKCLCLQGGLVFSGNEAIVVKTLEHILETGDYFLMPSAQ